MVERGPHSRKWERRVTETLPDGRILERRHSYVELANGMHYLKDGQWTESKEEVELVPEGAVALQGQHQVRFNANLNSQGAVHLTLPDGRVLQCHLLGLAFTDAASGQSVLIAGPNDSTGELLAPNKVIYRDAFDGPCRADVVFLYRRGSFEQFVIISTAPPSPAAYNLDPDSTLFEVWTEFMDPPEPVKRSSVLRAEEDPARRAVMVSPDLTDEFLDFASMCMTLGVAGTGSTSSVFYTKRTQRRTITDAVESVPTRFMDARAKTGLTTRCFGRLLSTVISIEL